MEDEPGLGVGFAIDAGGSFEVLRQLEAAMDTTEARIVREAASIERATGGMINLGGATAQVKTFGNATTREMQNVVRDKARAERAGERLIRQIEREVEAFGKTKSELRQIKAEEAALAAERTGNSDLARRIREQEAELWGKEAFAARQAAIARANAAEEEAAAEVRALAKVNAQLIERNRLQTALDQTMGTNRPRATDAGATFSALEARAAEEEAIAKNAAAAATERLAREQRELAAIVQGSYAAQQANADAAERMRMSTDPLYAAVSRLNAELAESTRLYLEGATAPAEYARQQEVLTGRLHAVQQQNNALGRGFGDVGKAGKLASHDMLNLAFQAQDLGIQLAAAAGSSDPLKMALTALAQQGAQVSGIAMQTGVGVRGIAGAFASMAKNALLAAVASPVLWAAGTAAGFAAVAFGDLKKNVDDDSGMAAYAKAAGLTKAELKKLGDTGMSVGDIFTGLWRTFDEISRVPELFGAAKDAVLGKMGELVRGTGREIAAIYGFFVGAYEAIVVTWKNLPAALGDVFVQAVNAAVRAINALVEKSVAGVNWMVDQANKILPAYAQLDRVTTGKIGELNNQWAGAAAKGGEAAGAAFSGGYERGVAQVEALGERIYANIVEANQDRTKKAIQALKDARDEKNKPDRAAERLARENAAIEAQIRNLYALAAAYRISGAAALIAEARVKAESDAIKKRGDIEVFVNRQVRLAIAERVVDAVKASAAQRDLATATAAVNGQVAAGIAPAERAGELIKDRIADLPLLAALEAAQQRGLAEAAAAATQALENQRKERVALRAAEATTQFNSTMASDADHLAALREELELIRATNAERSVGLAVLKAHQDALRMGFNADEARAYVERQREIAVATEQLTLAQAAYNQEMSFTADQWDLIARNVQDAARMMADAFGQVGQAIGDVASIYANYQADRASLDLQHSQEMKKFSGDMIAQERERRRYSLATAAAQIGMYGALAGSAKQFFKEGSAGYKAMAAAEKILAAVQLARAVQAIFLRGAETAATVTGVAVETGAVIGGEAAKTAATVAGTAVRTPLKVSEGAASMFAALGPFGFPAVAAMIAVMAALGFSGGKGGSGYTPPSPEDLQAAAGTGTVLGDTRAQSNSIANSLEIMASNSNSNLEYSNQMLRALKAIESGIGNLAGAIARQITVSGSMFDTSGLNIGQSGSGGFLGLFASSTTRSLYDAGIELASRTVGDIVARGITGSTYQIVQQVRRTSGFLGIGGGTRTTYQTTTGALDGDITAAIVDVIASLRAGLIQGADELGIAGAQALLDSFQVSIGRVSFQGMTGEEIEQQLNAIFSRVGDQMASTLYPQIAEMQQIGEGAFETFMRVAREYQVVETALASIGRTFGAVGLGSVQARDALIQLFGTMDEFVERTTFFAEKFLTEQERLAPVQAAVSAELARLGLSQIATMEQFKQAVLGLDLTTEAGREMYAALMALAPAFAALHQSASEVLSERVDLERRLLELQGNTAAIRARDLALLDPSNRALQEQIWAMEDAQEAARAAEQLREAWSSVGDGIMEEVRRIRGLTSADGVGGFAAAQGQFNAALAAAQGGDIDAARSLPGLSQALLRAAEQQATSRQELDRIRAQTAASLEQLFAAMNGAAPAAPGSVAGQLANAADAAAIVAGTGQDNGTLLDEVRSLRDEVAAMRSDNNAGHAANAAANSKTAGILENVTAESGGDAISTRAA